MNRIILTLLIAFTALLILDIASEIGSFNTIFNLIS